MTLPICPVHGKPGAVVFRCCWGAIGGKSRSRRKLKASKGNLAAMREKRERAKGTRS